MRLFVLAAAPALLGLAACQPAESDFALHQRLSAYGTAVSVALAEHALATGRADLIARDFQRVDFTTARPCDRPAAELLSRHPACTAAVALAEPEASRAGRGAVRLVVQPKVWIDPETRAVVEAAIADTAAFCRRVEQYGLNPRVTAEAAGCGRDGGPRGRVFVEFRRELRPTRCAPLADGRPGYSCEPPPFAPKAIRIR